MVRVYAITNQKGGVGKTKFGINLAAWLASVKYVDNSTVQGSPKRKVIYIDEDPQGHGTKGLGLRSAYFEARDSLYDLLVPRLVLPGQERHDVDLEKILIKPPTEDFFMIISHIKMVMAEQDLVSVRGREYRLKALVDLLVQMFGDELDIIIDCPPNLGILTDNAILATIGRGGIIIPILADKESIEALDLLLAQIESLEKALSVTVNKIAIVPNMVQDSKFARGVLTNVRASIPITLAFNAPKRVVVQEANGEGRSLFKYEPKESSKRKDVLEMREYYGRVMQEIEARCQYV